MIGGEHFLLTVRLIAAITKAAQNEHPSKTSVQSVALQCHFLGVWGTDGDGKA